MKKALFAGSFDPFTIGHQRLVERALPLFDSIVIGVGVNSNKSGYFDVEQRLEWIREAFKNEPKVEVVSYQGLTTDFAVKCGAGYLLRGVRSGADLDYERSVAKVNERLAPGLETILLMSEDAYVNVSSTMVRELHKYGKDIADLLPKGVKI